MRTSQPTSDVLSQHEDEVTNNVEVPQRKVIARPQRDGSIEMTPVESAL